MISQVETLPVACRQVGVRYGRTQAVEEATFQVEPGQVYALLGRNGSGKTSLVRCLLGHQKPTAGRVELYGQDVWSARQALMHRVGVVAEEPDAPPLMTARQLVRFCGGLYPSWDQAGVDERLDRFRIPLDLPFGRLSRGQKGQVALALALGPEPDLLVLDLHMPGIDGFHLLSTLRTMPETASVAIVVVSGMDRHDIEARGGLPPNIPILPKPIPFAELQRIAIEVAQRKQLIRVESQHE